MRHRTDIHLALIVAAFASLGAALIHVTVVPGHWEEWPLSGLFFAGIAVFQSLWAALVLRDPPPGVIALGIAANLGTIALWGAGRTWGYPPVRTPACRSRSAYLTS